MSSGELDAPRIILNIIGSRCRVGKWCLELLIMLPNINYELFAVHSKDMIEQASAQELNATCARKSVYLIQFPTNFFRAFHKLKTPHRMFRKYCAFPHPPSFIRDITAFPLTSLFKIAPITN